MLAAKGGIDLDGARARYPRVAEVPFDSDYKFMATFHRMADRTGRDVVRCFVKGAPDVLIARSSTYWSPDGDVHDIAADHQAAALTENERMASSGERVMVVARRDFDPDQFDPSGDLISLVQDLTLIAMVGIVDPPRAEAKAAIAKCHSAGIEVRMITGDHAVTAAAIGKELGIGGRALTGAEFAALTDEELADQLHEIGVVARVAPEDKIRLVHALQQQSNIVAMTGDGVNDAPALKKADIGVAMGITGTEVSKDAAVMILTDDNFATIVRAIEYGRELYDNLSKYIRFQMAALVGLHRHVPRRRDLLDRRRHPVLAARGALDQLRGAGPDRHRPRVRQAAARASWTASRARSPSRCSNVPQWVRAVGLGVLMADRDPLGPRRVRGLGRRRWWPRRWR